MSKPGTKDESGTQTAKPFSEGEDKGAEKSPGMEEAPHDRADAVGDAAKQEEMPKTTQRQE